MRAKLEMRRAAIGVAAAVAATLVAGCGGGSGTSSTPSTATAPPATSTPANVPTAPKSATETNPNAPDYAIGNRPGGPAQTAASSAFSSYISALNARNGERVCSLLIPSGTYNLHLPAKRESCAEGVSASIGHPNRAGLRWRHATIVVNGAYSGAGTVKLAVVVHNSYAGGKRVTEKEAVTLRKTGGHYRLAKPDDTLYRAIGAKAA